MRVYYGLPSLDPCLVARRKSLRGVHGHWRPAPWPKASTPPDNKDMQELKQDFHQIGSNFIQWYYSRILLIWSLAICPSLWASTKKLRAIRCEASTLQQLYTTLLRQQLFVTPNCTRMTAWLYFLIISRCCIQLTVCPLISARTPFKSFLWCNWKTCCYVNGYRFIGIFYSWRSVFATFSFTNA